MVSGCGSLSMNDLGTIVTCDDPLVTLILTVAQIQAEQLTLGSRRWKIAAPWFGRTRLSARKLVVCSVEKA